MSTWLHIICCLGNSHSYLSIMFIIPFEILFISKAFSNGIKNSTLRDFWEHLNAKKKIFFKMLNWKLARQQIVKN